jgi:bifunctional DNA-binding transcriptional regulator/antitoxin component of YhaV-PrlF toxin-antitoxin module
MSETVAVDKKGRLVLPKKVRQQAGIHVDTKLLARAKGIGRVELLDPDILMKRAQEIGAKKLAGWKEDEHEATHSLLESMKRKIETR